MTTSDAMELPKDCEVVLAWGVDYASLVYRDRGRWMDFMTKGVTHSPIDGWVPISLARKAREMEAAAKAASVLESGATLCGLCYTVNFEHMTKLRAALRDAGMGGGA